MSNSATQVTGQRRDHGKYCRNNIKSPIFSLLEKIPVPMELTELMETDTRYYSTEEATTILTSKDRTEEKKMRVRDRLNGEGEHYFRLRCKRSFSKAVLF